MATPSFMRRALIMAAVLVTATAALGFSQSASSTNPGHPSEPGVLVMSVQSGSPAEKAGLVRGDIIMEINGAAVNSQRDTMQAIAQHKKGDTVTVNVRHGDERKALSVALDEKNGRTYMGVLLFPEEHGRLGMRGPENRIAPWIESGGALVAQVASGGPADKAGIKRGDVILSVDGVQVDGDHSLSALIQDKKIGDTVTISVKTLTDPADKPARELKVTLGSTPDKKKPWLGVEYRQGLPTALLPLRGFPPSADMLQPGMGPSPDMPAAPWLSASDVPEPAL